MEQDPLNRKAYLRGWEPKDPPEDQEVCYWFCELAQNAADLETLDIANRYSSILNIGVKISSIQGGTHVLRNFEVEEFGDKFVIRCSGPFICTEQGTSNQSLK
jgi:hypothetical protein